MQGRVRGTGQRLSGRGHGHGGHRYEVLMEELPGAPVGTDRSRVALGRSKEQMPGQKDRTVGGR